MIEVIEMIIITHHMEDIRVGLVRGDILVILKFSAIEELMVVWCIAMDAV